MKLCVITYVLLCALFIVAFLPISITLQGGSNVMHASGFANFTATILDNVPSRLSKLGRNAVLFLAIILKIRSSSALEWGKISNYYRNYMENKNNLQ